MQRKKTSQNNKKTQQKHLQCVLPTGDSNSCADRTLTKQIVEQNFSNCAEMLLSLEKDISPNLFDELYEKMEKENEFLLSVINRQREQTRINKRINRTLPSQFFSRKYFDENLI